MKKRRWIVFCCTLLLLGTLAGIFVPRALELRAAAGTAALGNTIFLPEAGGCRILQITDVQMANMAECDTVFPMVREMVERAEPDLIVVTGDVLHDGAPKQVLTAFVELMDSFQIPWAVVIGNHDRNAAFSHKQMCKIYEQSEYCLFKKGGIDDRYGNYTYTLQMGGEAVCTLIFMDSGVEGFSAEQVDWYREALSAERESYGRDIPSVCFFHIPIPATVDANAAYKNSLATGTGKAYEPVDNQKSDSGFYEVMMEEGSTVALFYGHDHNNSTAVEYNGVLFCYGIKTGRSCYWREDMLGGSLITVTSDAEISVERLFTNIPPEE